VRMVCIMNQGGIQILQALFRHFRLGIFAVTFLLLIMISGTTCFMIYEAMARGDGYNSSKFAQPGAI
jgi:hypothetical protein